MVRFHPFIRLLLFIASALRMSSGIAQAQYWTPATSGLTGQVGSLAISPNGYMFASTLLNYQPQGVYRSTDGGTSWTLTPQPSQTQHKLGPVFGADSKGRIFVGGSTRQFRSEDNANTWQLMTIDSGSPFDPVISSYAIGPFGSMYIATQGSTLWATEDTGHSWYEQPVFQDPFTFPTFVAQSPAGLLFAGTGQYLMRASSRIGEFWDSIPGAPAFGYGGSDGVQFGFLKSGLIVAGGQGGLFFSTDTGSYWTPIFPPGVIANQTYYALALGSNNYIYAALSTGGVELSTDTGRDWTDISSPGVDTINALALNPSGELFAATNNGVFRFNPSGSGVSEGNAPASLTLEQNTPNPVSSNTSIRFTVPDAGPVSIRVFDATGREVATVANGFYATGTYSVTFDASKLHVGAYYYRIEADGQITSRMFVVEH